MIWRVTTRYATLTNSRITTTPPATYAMFDGLFQQALLRHLAGHEDAGRNLRAAVRQLVTTLVPTRPAP